MADYRHTLGCSGEDAAAKYLESLGHRIVARRWRSRHLEIDIVSETDDALHFVEVKTAGRLSGAHPSEIVGTDKMKNMFHAASAYLSARPSGKELRFDVVFVRMENEGGVIIEYVQEAFHPFF